MVDPNRFNTESGLEMNELRRRADIGEKEPAYPDSTVQVGTKSNR